MINIWFRFGAVFMALGVVLGAFGAHALKKTLTPEALHTYQTGVLYHLIHALGLFVVAWAVTQKPLSGRFQASGICLTLGILIFSGSLYLLALTGTRWLGAVTPIGGLLFIVGWALLI